MKLPVVEPDMVEAAIELFATRGFYGTTTLQIGKKAESTPASLHRLFQNKENLFHKALSTAISRMMKRSDFLLELFDRKGEARHIALALRKWYEVLPRPTSRLLYFASFFSDTSRKQATTAINEVVTTLAKYLHDDQKMPSKKAETLARAIFSSLLQFKATIATEVSQEYEMKLVDRMLAQWFL